MTDPTGKPAPSGGFQTGGWYSGYQYWNGTFAPQAGQIHPASTQQGAGQAVSPEVNAQTSVQAGLAPNANQDYINMLNQQPTATTAQYAPSATTTGASGGMTGTSAMTLPTTPELDLQSLYGNLQNQSGISDLQNKYLEQERAFINAKAQINDNPYLSEATRVGREAKLTKIFNENTANLQNEIKMKQADVETQMNLAMKQFDINSEIAKTNFAKFNSLLEMGALDNATGDDIANITRATGISSDMIQSAIKSRTAKVETQVIQSTADSGEVTVSVIDKNTGEIISQKSLGRIGNAQTGDTGVSSTTLNSAVKALEAVDLTGQQKNDAYAGQTTQGDKLLSEEEANIAYQSILALVNYDEAKANTLFKQAWDYGQFQTWTP